MRRSGCFIVPFAALVALVAPAPAHAHGLPGSSAESVPDFFFLGIRHILEGWDHLLFAAGIVLLAGGARRAAKLISVFVAGHSVTLLIATLAGWQLNAQVVDVVIAASVAYVGARIFHGRPRDWRATALAIFVFGLVHGLGLSTRLQELDLPAGGALVARLVAFNVGVEVGQIAVLTLVFGAGVLVARTIRNRARVARAVGGTLAAAGVVGVAVVGLTSHEPGESSAAFAPSGSCSEIPSTLPFDFSGGTDPKRRFYGPDEPAPEEDLAHALLADAFVVVRYSASLSEDERDELADWADSTDAVVVAPDTAAAAPALKAATTVRTLVCEEFELEQLEQFHERWLARTQGEA